MMIDDPVKPSPESTRNLLTRPQVAINSPSPPANLQTAENTNNNRKATFSASKHSPFPYLSEKMSIIPSFFGGRRTSSSFDPFSLDVWDPFKDFPLAQSFPEFSRETSAFVNTRIDWKETPESHVFKVDLPGLKKEEVKVEVEDDRLLQISGERNKEQEEKNDTWHRVERSSGKFMRRFRLPENAKMDQVKASMENGVLTVTVPKVEVKKPDVKSIEIAG